MGRPGYMSLYADKKTQQIFDEFVKIKGIKKTKALTEMLEIYMLCQDEELYTRLKKKSLGVEAAKQMLMQRTHKKELNDYIIMKLGTSQDADGNIIDGIETINAYIRNCSENGKGYTWFSTNALSKGMNEKKVRGYNFLCESGENVRILFAIGKDVNDIVYSARVLEIVSESDGVICPDCKAYVPSEFVYEEKAKIWIKITNIQEEKELKAEMLKFRKTNSNLKQVISNSQFNFGYVYIE
jgi:hypothetical protein